MPRMQVLSAEERTQFNTPPVFSSLDRKRYFYFTNDLIERAQSLKAPANKISFLLSCGYFKHSKKFFHPRDFQEKDIAYVSKLLGYDISDFCHSYINEASRRRQRNIITEHYGYRQFDKECEELLKEEVTRRVRSYLKPKIIFQQCVELCQNNHFITPGYDYLSKMILLAINSHKQSLSALVELNLSNEMRELIEALFEQEGDSKYPRYRLTLLKKLSQSIKPTQVKERSQDLSFLKTIYDGIIPLIKQLNLGNDGIQYFSTSVLKSDIFHVSRRHQSDRYIHVIAFVAHQYYRLQDNLVDTLLSAVASFNSAAKRDHKEKCYAQRTSHMGGVSGLLTTLDNHVLPVIDNIHHITQDHNANDTEKVRKISALLKEYHSLSYRIEEQKHIVQDSFNTEDFYEILVGRSTKLQNRISPILKALTFEADEASCNLLHAIEYFKSKEGAISKNAPLDFLLPEEKDAIQKTGSFRVSLYKVFLFLHVADALRSGRLNLTHSYKYRSLDGYLIDITRWHKEKKKLLKQAELEKFSHPGAVLKELQDALIKGYERVNKNINEGKQPYLKISNYKPFSIKTPAIDSYYSNLLRSYFPEKHFVPLPEILSTINLYTGFSGAFSHWQQRYNRKLFDEKPLYAAIVGLGCAIGIHKMARISPQINESTLENTVDWYFSRDNLIEANDSILAFMDKMDIPNVYIGPDGKIHTASDGSKYTVPQASLNASQSFKYFGQEQGISVNSFIDARGLLWYCIAFSAAERESAYVIDGLMHNNVIKSDIHSTDVHGYSESIFATAHLIGISYAPRIKDLKRQPLYIFKSHDKKTREYWKIKPDKYVNEALITEYWDDILRFIATIKLRESTASDIFRRLNSYSKQHKLYQALKAFGQIIKTEFILRYIDDVELRQAIEKQLNWVELSNRFSRAVSIGNPKEFSQVEGDDQNVAAHCTRLIKNSIVCWNYLYLSNQLEQMSEQSEREKLLNALASHSILCWEHTNLLGEYDFSDEKLKDSVGFSFPKNRQEIAA